MQIDKNGLEFIESLEGCVLKPYKDTKGIYTIGIGSTMIDGHPVTKDTPPITRDKALEMLKEYIDHVCSPRLANYRLTQNQYNALCSVIYNIGGGAFDNSTMKKLLDSGKYNIGFAIAMWDRPIEIIGRRMKERELYEKI